MTYQRYLAVLQRGKNEILSTLLFLDYAVPPETTIRYCLLNLSKWGVVIYIEKGFAQKRTEIKEGKIKNTLLAERTKVFGAEKYKNYIF